MSATLVSIIVTPISSSIDLPVVPGGTQQFTATGYYSDLTIHDLTSTATWAATYDTVATIGASTGLATLVGLGSTPVTATSGGVTGTATLTIAHGQHPHITPPIVMNTPLGHLKFRQYFTYDMPQVVAGPDPHQGHINYEAGNTVVIQPKLRDDLQNILEIRADIPAPKLQWGQEGCLAKDAAYPIHQIVESPTTTDSTAGIWTRGKYFAGCTPNW